MEKFHLGFVICIHNNLEYGNMFRICLNSFVLNPCRLCVQHLSLIIFGVSFTMYTKFIRMHLFVYSQLVLEIIKLFLCLVWWL